MRRALAIAGAVVGALLALETWVIVHVTTPRPEPAPQVGVSVSAVAPQETPYVIPGGTREPSPTPDRRVPPDPGHGPVPVCWLYPGRGVAPGATCPPKPR